MSKSLTTKNVAGVLIGLGLVLAFTFSFATTAKADALSDLQAQVNALLAQIAALQAASGTSGGACFTFTQNATVGTSGGEVMEIQKFLNGHGAQVAASGAGSPGSETSYFGGLTRAAVAKFQAANGISPTAGYWGPITRAKANSLCTPAATTPPGTTPPVVTPTGPGLTITAAAQPANSLAPGGTSRVPFTTFTLTNNTSAAVTVNGVTVQRAGLAVDAVFSGIVLVDEQGLQIDIAKTLNSNHQAIVGGTFTLNAGQTKTFTVSGNMQSAATLASYAGQVVSLSVVGVNTSVPVNGSLPITGASQTINSTLTVGSVTTNISSLDPNSAQTKNIGDTGLKFSGLRFTAGSAEDLKLYSVRWRLNGTVSANDLANITTVVSGTSYPTTISSDGRYFTALFPGGILITKGNSVDVTIQGDVIGTNASGRVAQFDVDKTSDVYFVGQLYGYGIAPAAGSGSVSTAATHATTITSGTPWFQGSTFSISGASVTTISKATSVPAQNVAVNVSNQPLGGYVTNFTGEAVSVQGHTFTIATSTGQSGYITSVSIYDENGAVVAGPVDASGVGATLTFTDTITYPTGLHTWTIKGKVPSTYTNGGTIQLSTTPSGWTSVTGQTTGNTVTISTGNFAMNTMTVRAAALTMGLSTTPSAQTIVAGGQSVVFANIQLDASQSGEDVRISSVPLHVDQAYVAAGGTVTNLTTCQITDSAGTILNGGSNTVNSFTSLNDATTTAATTYTKTFTFDNSLTIPKGTVKVLTLKCNVGSGATANDSYRFKTYSGDTLTFTGVTSGNSSSATIVSAQAGRQTVASAGTVAVSTDTSSPNYAIGAGGTTGVTIGVAKFRPSNEAVNLEKIGLTLTGGTYSGPSGAQDLVQAYIYNGQTLVGTATFTGNATTATSTLLSAVNLPKDVDTKLTIKVDLADVGTSQTGTSGDLVKVDVADFEGSGASSGTTVRGGAVAGLTAVSGVRLYNTYPTQIANLALPSGSTAAGGTLMRFSVTANAAGDVGIARMTFTVATSAAANTITTLGLYGYTDSNFSSAISGQGTGGLIGATVTATSTSNIPFSVLTSPVEVPAGQTYYFELRGSTGGFSTGHSITTTLLGDSATAALAATTSIVGNFIWSPNSTTTSVAVANDWTSANGVVGLPSGGFTRSVSQ